MPSIRPNSTPRSGGCGLAAPRVEAHRLFASCRALAAVPVVGHANRRRSWRHFLADTDVTTRAGAGRSPLTPRHAAGARIGTAGWAIPAASRDGFPAAGTGLERYAARFNAAEINSSFHRPHRPATYERWAACVPADFAFAVKLPKAITHGARLIATPDLLAGFAAEVGGLGGKLGVILVQLPPSLALDPSAAGQFFEQLRNAIPAADIACEPRHVSWFTAEANALLAGLQVARGGSCACPDRRPARRLGRPVLSTPARFSDNLPVFL